MDNQNDQNFENQETKVNEEVTAAEVKKSLPKKTKMAIVISAGVLAVAALALLLIFVVFKHEHDWSGWTVQEKATYSSNGREYRYCVDASCGEKEYRTIEAYGDAGLHRLLNGHWRARGASKEDFLIDILFNDSNFTATVYMYGKEYSYMGGSGTVEITDDLITLKQSNGTTYISFVYETGNDTIVLIDSDIEAWEKYEP